MLRLGIVVWDNSLRMFRLIFTWSRSFETVRAELFASSLILELRAFRSRFIFWDVWVVLESFVWDDSFGLFRSEILICYVAFEVFRLGSFVGVFCLDIIVGSPMLRCSNKDFSLGILVLNLGLRRACGGTGL